MSAEALRAYTRDKVATRIGEYTEEAIAATDWPLDKIRLNQGIIRGMREALDLQQEAYKGMGD